MTACLAPTMNADRPCPARSGAGIRGGIRASLRTTIRATVRTVVRAVVVSIGLVGFTPSPAATPDPSGPAMTSAQAIEPIVITDDRRTEHRFASPPQRIVSLLPSLTESVWALGGGDRLVGVDRYSNWPPELEGLPRLGGLDDALIEPIARLRPDVILAALSARSLDRLEALGFRVIRLRSESHADVRRSLDRLARLLGRPEAATTLWATIQARLAVARARVPESARGRRAYFEIGGGPYAAGTSSFIGETMAQLGLANIAPAELGPFPKLNPEFVVRARPWLIIGTDHEIGAIADRPGWRTIPAVQAGRICGFDTRDYDMLVRPGPRIGDAAGLLVDCLVRVSRATDEDHAMRDRR